MLNSYGAYDEKAAIAHLEELAGGLRANNPDLPFLVDENAGVVWLRDVASGKDFGIYSLTITGAIVECYDGNSTPLHRAIPQA